MALLIEISQARGRTLAFNGVCGNLGVALAAGITGVLASTIGWRYAFAVPGLLCLITGVVYWFAIPDERVRGQKRKATAQVPVTGNNAIVMFGLYIIISICGGLTFNTILIALPKSVDERLADGTSLAALGGVATPVFLCGALRPLAVGRVVEKIPPAGGVLLLLPGLGDVLLVGCIHDRNDAGGGSRVLHGRHLRAGDDRRHRDRALHG